MDIKERIRGAFIGLYFGSGVNPRFSPMLTPEEARKRFGNKRFDEYEDYEIYGPRYKLYDQHTQTKIIYDILLKYGKITPEIFGDYLLELHKKYDVFKGDVYGPSTQRAVKAILAGEDIYQMGRKGVTVGAAMRALPIGMYFYNNTDSLLENTVNSCIVSHNTDIAIEAAIATNITLANLINGKNKFEAINGGIEIVTKYHGKFGERTSEPKIYERIQNAINLVKGKTMEEATSIIQEKIGVGMHFASWEIVPAAFANYLVTDTPQDISLLSMRCGGENQTPPEIACAFLGAEKGPDIFPKAIIKKIEEVNSVKIYEMADKLIKKIFKYL